MPRAAVRPSSSLTIARIPASPTARSFSRFREVSMSSLPVRAADMRRAILIAVPVLALAAGCASSGGMRQGRAAEQAQDYDRAVVEYTNAARTNPDNREARLALHRVKL